MFNTMMYLCSKPSFVLSIFCECAPRQPTVVPSHEARSKTTIVQIPLLLHRFHYCRVSSSLFSFAALYRFGTIYTKSYTPNP